MTSTHQLWMIEFKPNIQTATRWMLEQPRSIIRPGHDDGYGWHAILAAAFGDLAPKPFRILEKGARRSTQDTVNPAVQLLAYSQSDPNQLVEHARLYAAPAVMSAVGLDDIASKSMPALFAAGQRLGFEVRVRPTVRQDRGGDRNRSIEKDAFLASVDAEAKPRGERPELSREDVYKNWLNQRLIGAADLDERSFRIVQLNRTMLLRPRQDGPREVQPVGLLKRGREGEQGGSPDATFQGELTITDPARFHALLARGIGRHLSFGFGMLLLRPPRRR